MFVEEVYPLFPGQKSLMRVPQEGSGPCQGFRGLTTSSPQHAPLTLILQRLHLLHLVHHLALGRGSNMVTDQMTHGRVKTEQGAFV